MHRTYDYWARTHIWNPEKHRLIPRTPPSPRGSHTRLASSFSPTKTGDGTLAVHHFAVYVLVLVQPTLEGGRTEDGVARVSRGIAISGCTMTTTTETFPSLRSCPARLGSGTKTRS